MFRYNMFGFSYNMLGFCLVVGGSMTPVRAWAPRSSGHLRMDIYRREGLSIPAYFIPAHVDGGLVKDPGLLSLLLFRGLGPYRLKG